MSGAPWPPIEAPPRRDPDPTPTPTPDPGSGPMAGDRRDAPRAAVLTHPAFGTHDPDAAAGIGLEVDPIVAALDAAPWSDRVIRLLARPATAEQVALAHDPAFVARALASAAPGGGRLDAGARLVPASSETALLAAGGVIAAVDAVMRPDLDRPDGVFCLVRPPGHHAAFDRAMGFSLVNNVAIAARHAQRTYGLERVLVLDWDAHHGSGTADIVRADPSVLFVSLHQWPLYPGSGWFADVGRGPGRGYAVNVPFPPGAGDPAYRAAFDQIVEPIAEQFAPQLVLVSAGQDCHVADPLADLLVTLDGFRFMARAVRRIADRHAHGRHVLALEGGSNRRTLPWLVAGIVAALGDLPDDTADPFAPPDTATLPPAHDERLQAVAATLAPYWRL